MIPKTKRSHAMSCTRNLWAALCLLLASAGAQALPTLSLDLDPLSAGHQDALSLTTPAQFRVDVVIEDVGAAQPLNAFELDLGFDAQVVQALSVTGSGFLLDPVFEVRLGIGPGNVDLALVTLGAAGASGDGVLASILFETVAPGTSPLDLFDVILSAPFGVRIPVAAVGDGVVRVSDTQPLPPPIPEPTAGLLFGVGGAVVARRVRRAR